MHRPKPQWCGVFRTHPRGAPIRALHPHRGLRSRSVPSPVTVPNGFFRPVDRRLEHLDLGPGQLARELLVEPWSGSVRRRVVEGGGGSVRKR